MTQKPDTTTLPPKYRQMAQRLADTIAPDRLICDPLRTLAYGTDASFYRLVPKIIVKVENEAEVLAALQSCRELSLPATFRAAGTSLSGQALSDSVLMVLGPEGWRKVDIAPDRSLITLGVGILGAEANRHLAPYGKKIGPDPASINSAKIGGIVSNNACGMASGVDGNSMGTIAGMRIIFADGTILDTRDPESRTRISSNSGATWSKVSRRWRRSLKPILNWSSACGASTRLKTPPATASTPC